MSRALDIAKLGIGAGALAIATLGLFSAAPQPPVEPEVGGPWIGVLPPKRLVADLEMPLLVSSAELYAPAVVQNPPRLIAERRSEEEIATIG